MSKPVKVLLWVIGLIALWAYVWDVGNRPGSWLYNLVSKRPMKPGPLAPNSWLPTWLQ